MVEVRDGSNNPQAGTTVDFTVTAGGGSVAPVSAVTGANGQASTSLTLGPAAGTHTVQATATGIGTVTFTATANPAPEPPTQLALSPVNATTTVNTPVVYQATIQDQFGNPVTGATNPVTFSVAGLSGTFSPSATVTPVNGVASVQFTPTTSGTATLTAAASGLSSATTNLTVTEAQGGTTVLTTQVPVIPNATDGVNYELGMKFRSAVAGSITAIRHWKSPSETGSHVGHIWTATGTLLATVTFSNETASGWQQQALTTPLSIQPNTTYVVSVNVNSHFPDTYEELGTPIVNGNLSSVADGNNGVWARPPGTFPTNTYRNSNYYRDIVFTTGPTITKLSGDNQSGEVNTTLGQPLVVEVRDGSGNPQAGTTVNFTVTAGGDSVTPVSAVTNADGQASTSLTLGPAAGTHTVQATATGIGTVTFTATANRTAPTQLALSPVNATTAVNTPVTYQATIQDQFGNTVTGATNPVIFSVAGVSGTFSPSATVTPVNGVASVQFTPTTSGTATLTAAASGLTSATVSLIVTSGTVSATQLALNPVNATTTVNTPVAYQATIQDQFGNPVIGATNPVTFSVAGLSGTFSPSATVTPVNGVASVQFAPTTSGTATLTAAASGLTSAIAALTVNDSSNHNSIVLENQKPGTNAWEIAYDDWVDSTAPETSELSDSSVNVGGSLDFKISLSQTGQYNIKVYRLGFFYGGAGGRLMINTGPLAGGPQSPCIVTDSTTRLIECNWSTTYTLQVGTDWTSGLYIANLTDIATNKQSQIWFVVRNDASTSDILFQSSFTTFLAYNNFGDGDLYSVYEYNSTGGQRAFKVSFDRPFAQVTIDRSNYMQILRFEYPMARWLESQGYDVSYVTNVDVHNNPGLLRRQCFRLGRP